MGLLDQVHSFAQGASNGVAGSLTGPVDGLAWLLRKAGVPMPDAPMGGSDWMRNVGLMQEPKERMAGLLGEGIGSALPTVIAGKAPQIANGLLQMERNAMAPRTLNPQTGAIVWHGSPHKFDKFDSSKIGTGEGAQAYGHGLYLAESKGVAGSYQESLSTDPERFLVDGKEVFRRQANGPAFDVSDPKTAAIFYAARKGDKGARKYFAEQGAWGGKAITELDAMKGKAISRVAPGNLYQVDLPDDQIAKMLDWDKPLSQQAPEVRAMAEAALRSAKRSKSDIDWLMDKPGAQLENFLMPSGNRSEASQRLSEAGIPGIRYLDGGSRGAGAGTSNFVVFPGNEGLLKILERNGQGLLGN